MTWKSSKFFGINYHLKRTPDSHNYFPGDPVSSPSAAKAELALMASVAANHQSVLYGMWERGIVPLETQIMQEFNRFRYVQAPGVRYGVLLIGTVFESIGVQPVRRSYHSTHIEGAFASYEMALNSWKVKDKLLPAMPGSKINYYHVWAERA